MNMTTNDELWEEYFIPGSNVLKNKFDITDREELLKVEAQVTFEKTLNLQINPICTKFDEEDLKAIHYYLFNDIYYFAGEYRTVYMEKNNSYFAPVRDISMRLQTLFDVMNSEITKVTSEYSFACFLAEVYVELLNIHPFREGNGRTIREFIREFANEKSKELSFGEINFSWANVDSNAINSVIDKARAFRSIIELEFLKAFEKVDNVNLLK